MVKKNKIKFSKKREMDHFWKKKWINFSFAFLFEN